MTGSLAVLVDLDGTVASPCVPDGTLTRHHHRYRAVGWDLPNEPIIAVVRALHAAGHQIIFCSVRPIRDEHGFDVGRASYRWLFEHAGKWTLDCPLLMRAEGDRRSDEIVKREIYESFLEDHYDVRIALDDRTRVVNLGRPLGITCLQVADGDF